ncbi:MAG: 16S rRNA processing protein RimM [Selenomonadaceae bacterium]|nr:16S rRNA processing protein RimM [Selenomonadaceae bacterium]
MTKSLPSEAEEQRVIIGKVGAPHGVAGEVKIFPLTDFPGRFAAMKAVMVGEERLAIAAVKERPRHLLMKFVGYETRDKAALLTGKLLTVSRAEAAPLNDGEFYTFDIIGLTVKDAQGETLGKVINVLSTGSNDVYVTELASGGELLIPALKKVVTGIDLTAGEMTIDRQQLEDG